MLLSHSIYEAVRRNIVIYTAEDKCCHYDDHILLKPTLLWYLLTVLMTNHFTQSARYGAKSCIKGLRGFRCSYPICAKGLNRDKATVVLLLSAEANTLMHPGGFVNPFVLVWVQIGQFCTLK